MGLQISKPEIFIPGPLYPDLFDDETPIMLPGEAVCLGCGCTDSNACVYQDSDNLNHADPCHWLAVNYEAGIGACSNCEPWVSIVEDWEAITSDRNRKGRCRRCKLQMKDWLHVFTPRGPIAIQYCTNCYG